MIRFTPRGVAPGYPISPPSAFITSNTFPYKIVTRCHVCPSDSPVGEGWGEGTSAEHTTSYLRTSVLSPLFSGVAQSGTSPYFGRGIGLNKYSVPKMAHRLPAWKSTVWASDHYSNSLSSGSIHRSSHCHNSFLVDYGSVEVVSAVPYLPMS